MNLEDWIYGILLIVPITVITVWGLGELGVL